ncbi:L-lactate permease [Methylopila jiangsuensis]|uniref:L-lactate permease n=1 Tax=Methylopila jiangsuensis TaxID=586230 RepID=A0A9W6N4F1_9HYPH|nr:L-lactate permease [Methylopila jiangsuensis]MDR6286400.1 lactate permease [Methylopila jiangsuensis]GLK77263.1 L-lactate permease [Methylopila jiangsuensis]
MMWSQVYDPFGNAVLSTLVAAIPIVVLLAGIGVFHMKAHTAAIAGLVAALLIAVLAHGMPVDKAGMTAIYGAAYGLLPIGWIILNIIFLYQLTNEKGYFKILQDSIAGITGDRRLQLLLIAFSFGAFFEGAAGFGTPVAVTGAILIGLGFSPLAASGLSLIANTAPVAYGALGTPVIALAAVTGLPLLDLSAMIGRQLPFFSILVPFWLIAAFAGFRGMAQIWPAILVAGVAFAVPQFLVSNYHGPWLVDVVAAIASIVCLTLFLRVWSPKLAWTSADGSAPTGAAAAATEPAFQQHPTGLVVRAWIPWLILSVVVFCWGIPQVKAALDGVSMLAFEVPTVHNLIERVPPVVAAAKAEAAVYKLNWLSATGSGIFLSAVIAGFVMGFSPLAMLKTYWRTLVLVRFSLLTIAAMLALGFVTRYSGVDATLGLAFAKTGWLYPFFGAMLGWLGVALTGSDTSSNVLFGSLQRISAEQLGLSPTLMAAANSSGGVMGKMIDAQSIVVASTATRWYGHEGDILRYVFFHSLALAALMGLLVMAQAYIPPFTHMVIGAP